MDFNIAPDTKYIYLQNSKSTVNKKGEKSFSNNFANEKLLNAPNDNHIKAKTLIPLMNITELVTRAEIIAQKASIPSEIASSNMNARIYKRQTLNTVRQVERNVDSVISSYKEGETEVLGKYKREILFDPKNNCETMLETDGNGTILRKSTFKDGVLADTTVFNEDGSQNITKLSNGMLRSYKEGYIRTEEGNESMRKYLTFNLGKPSICFENYKEQTDGYSYSSESIWFGDDEKIAAYYGTMESFQDGSSIVELHLRYNENEQVKEYVEGIKDGYLFSKKYILEDGKWIEILPPVEDSL